jgi:hypothetical protein
MDSGLLSRNWINGHTEDLIANKVRMALGYDPIYGTLQPECIRCSAEFGGRLSNLGRLLRADDVAGMSREMGRLGFQMFPGGGGLPDL